MCNALKNKNNIRRISLFFSQDKTNPLQKHYDRKKKGLHKKI